MAQPWLALAIGNSRLHWGWFDRVELLHAWDTPHLNTDDIHKLTASNLDFRCCPPVSFPQPPAVSPPELWVASAVPRQTLLWQSYPHTRTIALGDVPLGGVYPTLGIDRALVAWGASQQQPVLVPVLVIDGGTALTLTGVNAARQLVGGAIWPGLRLQLRSLSQATAALPDINAFTDLPPRWAMNTMDAIRSGVLYSATAGLQSFIAAWQQQYPDSAIILTGGDGALLQQALTQLDWALTQQIAYQPHLLLQSIAYYRARAIDLASEQS